MKSGRVDVIIHIDDDTSDGELEFSGKFVPHMIAERIKAFNPGTLIYFSLPSGYNGRLKEESSIFVRESADDINYWKNVFSSTSAEHLAVIKADSPFFDPDVLREMSDIHIKYLAEFTYSENLPEGFSCEIISGELMEQLPDIKEKTLPLAKVIKANINQFDVELYYREPDLRDKRLSFRLANPRERKIMENIAGVKGGIPEYAEVSSIITAHPEVLFAGPSYLEIELNGSCSLDCIFCYRKSLKKEHTQMSIDTLKKIVSDMRSFDLPYTVCFGGSGEPMEHPDFYAMMDIICSEPLAEQLIIETNGIRADANFKSFISQPDRKKIKVIVNNSGLDRDSYLKLHGTDSFETLLANMVSLEELNPDSERIYLQVMKINETDGIGENESRSYLDRFYDFWEKLRIPIILQKQDTYFGKIKDRRYSDLSPLKRHTCWHLQRDMYILADGTVAFCKQDIDGENSRGNVKGSSLTEIWEKQKVSFIEEYNGRYATRPDCRNCDEWYTFNF